MIHSDIVFLALNTPTKAYGEGAGLACDLTNIEKAVRMIGKSWKGVRGKRIIVEKSTVPVRTAAFIKTILKAVCP